MNQCDQVLLQLRGGSAITSLQMIQLFGITRLATHIHVLRQDGWPIKTEMVEVRNRFGQRCTVARYSLKPRARRRRSPRADRVNRAALRKPAPRKQRTRSARARAKGRA
jgi:hypothetical protein